MEKESKDVLVAKQPKIKKPINYEGLIIAIVIAVVVLLTVGIVLYYFYFADNEKLATYDGGELTRGEYEMYYKRYVPYYVYYYGVSVDNVKQDIAKQVVIDEVAYAKAVKEGYKIKAEDKKEIDDQFSNEDNIKSIQEQEIDPQKLKSQYYKDAVISAYIDDMKTKVKTGDVKNYIKSSEGDKADLNIYNTSHILLKFDSEMTDVQKAELKKKAEKLLAKAKEKGADFAKLAKANSDDTSKDNGGKVSVKANDTIYKEYEDAVVKLSVGQIYPSIVETQAGYHIIKLNSIDKEGRLTDETDIANCAANKVQGDFGTLNYKADEDRISQIADTLAKKLGLASAANTTTGTSEAK